MRHERTATGAILGAAIGSVVPGVGTIIGGIIGGWLGRQAEPEPGSPEAQWEESLQLARLLVSAATTGGDRMPVVRRKRLHDVLSIICTDLPKQDYKKLVQEATLSRAWPHEVAGVLETQAASGALPPLLFPLLMVYYGKPTPTARDRAWLAEVSARLDPSWLNTAVGCFERTESPDEARDYWLEVLGLNAEATDDDVRSAWRQMALDYHPDRLAAVPPAVRKLAEEKMQQVNAAYKYLTTTVEERAIGQLRVLTPANDWSAASALRSGDVATCALCLQHNRLPSAPHLLMCRCGRCSALLLLPGETVDQLTQIVGAMPPS